MKYPITQNDKTRYIGLVLLNEIINFQHYFLVEAQGDNAYLKPYLAFMYANGWLDTKNDGKIFKKSSETYYIPTEKGREELVNLYAKYQEYLKIFDIYCAVDLEKGEFAFSRIQEDMTTEDWYNFLDEERFSDVRVAVAAFKGLNPSEIVFMSFLNENRFDLTVDGWQNALTDDEIWREIEDICETAVDVEYLKENDVIQDVIKQGTEIAMQLIKDAEDSLDAEEEEETITTTTTTTEEVEEYVDVVELPYYGYDYYDPYYDPYYISPIWIVPIILLY